MNNREGGPPLALLHSRFPQFRREELETEWLARLGKKQHLPPGRVVLVATQVVEQSVDIDADFVVTDLAPTDMLLQRLGDSGAMTAPGRPARSPNSSFTFRHAGLLSILNKRRPPN